MTTNNPQYGKFIISRGIQGPPGPTGPAGEPAPAGGTAGQVLSKVSNADHDVAWIDQVTNNVYAGPSTTTTSVGGLSAGADVSGKTYDELLAAILSPYIAPSFSSFSMVGQSATIEVGTAINGSKSFSFSFANGANVSANTLSIIDQTTSTTLGTNLSITSPVSVNVGTNVSAVAASHSWIGRATNTQTTVFSSTAFTVNWYWRLFSGTSSNTTLTAPQIQALVNSSLSGSKNGTFSLAAGGYKFFAWADSLGSPTATTGFKDTATNLAVSMADASDNAAFSNTQNGWSYALVSVTNTNGITTNYRVYRTKNILGSSINIQVS